MAPHSSTLAWKIPWTEEPGRLQSMESLRVGQDRVTSLSLFTFMHWRRKWQPTPVFFLESPRHGGVWWAAVYGVAQSRTQLKRLSSSSRRMQAMIPRNLTRVYYTFVKRRNKIHIGDWGRGNVKVAAQVFVICLFVHSFIHSSYCEFTITHAYMKM